MSITLHHGRARRFTAGSAGLLATAFCLMLAAAPAGASGRPTLASVIGNVHAADAALVEIRAGHPAAARRALARNRADIAAAAHMARWLHSTGRAASTARGFALVAGQYDRDVRAYTRLIPASTGSLQAQLAQALGSAVAGRAQAVGFLGQLTGALPTPGIGVVTGIISGLLKSLPGEIQSLAGLVNGGALPPQIQALVAQALTTATGLLEASIAQVQGIIPTLPPAVQPILQAALSQLTAALGQVTTALGRVTTTISGIFGGVLSAQLSQVTSLLPSILGGLGGSTTGSGAPAPLAIPSFIQGLLGQLGLGGLPFGFATERR